VPCASISERSRNVKSGRLQPFRIPAPHGKPAIVREKELRLALVCYGGVSLAVYMHGITKEIWQLARASNAFHSGMAPATPSEAVFVDLLRATEKTGGVKLRVLADIIAGASAGGINGIFLAQAIATGQSLDPLTKLWLDHADIDALLDRAATPAWRFAKYWALPIAWWVARRQTDLMTMAADRATVDEVRRKLSRFVRARWFRPPFGGATFTALLLDAFDAMAAAPMGPRLLPEEQPLDLFVTVTDFHGHPETLKLNSPPEIAETEHRMTLSFRDSPADLQSLDDRAALTFAARATASFPGAFPPFTAQELDRVLAATGRQWSMRDAFLSRILPRRFAMGVADKAVLIDGSVLANAPFKPAIDALKARPAHREVDRRFVYIDPKPGIKTVSFKSDRAEVPGFFTTIFGALSDIPREQPIRDNLEALASRSARIRRMRAIVEALRPDVENAVASLFGHTFFLDRPTPARLAAWRAKADARAARDAGHSWLGYCQLKTASICEAQPRDAVLRDAATLAPEAFFSRHDLDYRIRRLRFVSRVIADLDETRASPVYEALRNAIYRELSRYLALQVTPDALADLATRDAETDSVIAGAIADCAKADRRAPLLAYLGFPFYDVATLALLQGEGFDEFDEIKVDRISPEDAKSIRSGGTLATLKGIQFNSFGAFFSRAYRENDYLWGRLHGAERLVDIVASTLPPLSSFDPATIAQMKHALFLAILAEEAPHLTAIAPLFAELHAELAGGKTG
jgi:predicted acylesterase/phospholipase RssA